MRMQRTHHKCHVMGNDHDGFVFRMHLNPRQCTMRRLTRREMLTAKVCARHRRHRSFAPYLREKRAAHGSREAEGGACHCEGHGQVDPGEPGDDALGLHQRHNHGSETHGGHGHENTGRNNLQCSRIMFFNMAVDDAQVAVNYLRG
jgi:hypothetical protein